MPTGAVGNLGYYCLLENCGTCRLLLLCQLSHDAWTISRQILQCISSDRYHMIITSRNRNVLSRFPSLEPYRVCLLGQPHIIPAFHTLCLLWCPTFKNNYIPIFFSFYTLQPSVKASINFNCPCNSAIGRGMQESVRLESTRFSADRFWFLFPKNDYLKCRGGGEKGAGSEVCEKSSSSRRD